MTKKILARLAMLLLVLFGVTLLTFFYTSLSPVDAAQALAVRRYTRPTEEQITAVRAELVSLPLWFNREVNSCFDLSRSNIIIPQARQATQLPLCTLSDLIACRQ